MDFEALATETANKITEKETQVQELETTKQSVDDVTAKIDAVVGGARSIINIMDIIRQTCQRCLTGVNLQSCLFVKMIFFNLVFKQVVITRSLDAPPTATSLTS